MKETIRRRLTPLGTGVAVALVLALPARATPPESYIFAATAFDSVSCAGFEAKIERSFTGRETAYFDQRGNVVRVQVVADMRGSVTNAVTGKAVALRGHILLLIDLTAASTVFVGPVIMANAAGAGAVIEDTGRIVFDADGNVTFAAGPHDVIDGEGAVFCLAVA
jgi:hypothetical protein